MRVEANAAGELWRQARVVEAVESYARAGAVPTPGGAATEAPYATFIDTDMGFWTRALAEGLRPGMRFAFDAWAFTEWVARVPGLYWKSRLEHGDAPPLARSEEHIGKRWRALPPIGKSERVSGGVGTLRLGAAGGERLCSITAACNASVGVPVVVTDAMLTAGGVGEGAIVRGEGVWQSVPREWSDTFRSLRGLPRGCLRLTALEAMPGEGTTQVLVHPYSVMEYDAGGRFYDFVFADMTSDTPVERREVADFFDAYASASGRRGRYLLGADAVEPMWDAAYVNPEALRDHDGLAVLRARLDESLRGERSVEALVRALTRAHGAAELAQLATFADVPAGWQVDGVPLGQLTNRLVRAAAESDRVAALVDAVAWRYPGYWADAQGGPPAP